MMTTTPLLFLATLLLAACGSGGDGEGNRAAGPGSGKGSGSGSAPASSTPPAGPIRAGESLTGLYEKKEGGLSSQLCIVERSGSARFGLNLWGANMHSCSGAGTAVREGNRLTLAMAGDRACSIQATIEGNAIRLPETVPEGCSYYCGAGARMTGLSLARTGASEADALKARDVVDEPLCDSKPG